MSNKLYVGNISFQTEESGLEKVFGEHGGVSSVKIITDRQTGRSKGFGFVEMETSEAAQKCVETLDGQEIDGRTVKVNIAKEKTDRPPRDNRW